MSSNYPTPLDCLRELGPKIQREHDPTCVAGAQKLQSVDEDATSTKRPSDEGASSLNANDVLILHSRLKIIQECAVETKDHTGTLCGSE